MQDSKSAVLYCTFDLEGPYICSWKEEPGCMHQLQGSTVFNSRLPGIPAYVCVCVSLSLPLRVSAGQPQLLFLAFQDPGPELLVEPQVVFVNQFKC